MKYVADMHTHTLASGHAYNTINEMIRAASEKKLEIIGITEHAPAMPGSTNVYYFQNLNILEREKYGIEVRYGAELNIIDLKGTTDLDPRSYRDLDYCIASLHTTCLVPGTKKENTYALLQAMQHPKVRIIGHPDDGHFPTDYEALIKEAKAQDVLIELNNASFNPRGFRIQAYENDIQILKLCVKYGVEIMLGSDAHREEDVGDFTRTEKILKEVDFPEELIVNCSLSYVKNRLRV
ncbi:phosphatase [Blautia wexlerae]|uniref:phosphatase n=1 Tax=Blautia wexlerae TaxID=418240 RepID=UPI00156E9555|nr:phosphatase [Blautia wexlerae]NSK18451.1 phosphatase [Blautia wexlerae]